MASMTKIFHHSPYPTISTTNPSNDQTGRSVVITGSSSGIGFAIAKAFVQANASSVIILGRSAGSLEQAVKDLKKEAKSTKVEYRICDVNSESSIESFWKSITADKIPVDVLVLSATDGTHAPITPLLDKTSLVKRVFNANVTGNSLMAGYFLNAASSSSRPKSLLNISTAAAHCNPAPAQALYGSSKAAIACLFQHLAEEVPEEQCQIINFHPGVVLTEGAKRESHPEMIKLAVYDEIELPAAFAVWASTPAAAFLHGRFVWANWDMEEIAQRKKDFEDPGYLKIGLQGVETLKVATFFDDVRKKDAERGL